jgi:hypothetical protein
MMLMLMVSRRVISQHANVSGDVGAATARHRACTKSAGFDETAH